MLNWDSNRVIWYENTSTWFKDKAEKPGKSLLLKRDFRIFFCMGTSTLSKRKKHDSRYHGNGERNHPFRII